MKTALYTPFMVVRSSFRWIQDGLFYYIKGVEEREGESLPLPLLFALDLLKDKALIIFVKATSLDCDCVIELGTVILVMLGTMIFELKSQLAKFL